MSDTPIAERLGRFLEDVHPDTCDAMITGESCDCGAEQLCVDVAELERAVREWATLRNIAADDDGEDVHDMLAEAEDALLRAIRQDKCEHGAGLTDYCEPCGRIHGQRVPK